MKILCVLCSVLLCLLSYRNYAVELIKHNGIDQTLDEQKHYFPSILQLAIDKSVSKYGPAQLVTIELPMPQQRQFKSLDDHIIDVMWTMTSNKLEKEALPVRIPLLKGLLGYRVLVIRKNQETQFSAITQLEQLKNLTAVQGFGWADVDILRSNGLKVEESSWYDSIYKSLNAGYYDYFPRSILEAQSELANYSFDNLKIAPQHLLIYPTAIYFFVSKQNSQLAERLHYGLTQAIVDGSFEQLFRRFPQHISALQELAKQNRVVLQLSNPTLPADTPLDNPTFWYQFPQQKKVKL